LLYRLLLAVVVLLLALSLCQWNFLPPQATLCSLPTLLFLLYFFNDFDAWALAPLLLPETGQLRNSAGIESIVIADEMRASLLCRLCIFASSALPALTCGLILL
jgi:hypothetical protein